MESAPKRFLVETERESDEEKLEIGANADPAADPAHARASSRVRGWKNRMIFDQYKLNNNRPYKKNNYHILGGGIGTCCTCLIYLGPGKSLC